uniref:Uncharacterized protein n=1 Tax=Arundo donax TaxID=35708 RepID=A0A0A9EYU0_ARUDO
MNDGFMFAAGLNYWKLFPFQM